MGKVKRSSLTVSFLFADRWVLSARSCETHPQIFRKPPIEERLSESLERALLWQQDSLG